MTYITRRFSHEKRVVHLAPSDPTLTLDYNYLLNSGSTISQSVLAGPTPIFTRASDAHSFDSSGNFVAVGANDLPRYAHDPNDSNSQQGLLMNNAVTNICLQSSTFGTTWALQGNTDIPTTNNTDIFGTSTADEIAATNTADERYGVNQSFTGLTANTATSVAVYIKTGTNATFVQLVWDSDGGATDGCFCNFQLTGAGTAGTVTALAAGTASHAEIGLAVEGFYQVSMSGDIDAGTVGRFTINIIDNINAAVNEAANLADNDSLIACAADVQVQFSIRTHIPTTTSSVTVAEDICSTTDMSWVDTDVMTWYVEGEAPFASSGTGSGNRTISYLHDSSDFAPAIDIRSFEADPNWLVQLDQAGGGGSFFSAGSEANNTIHQLAATFDGSTEALVFDGDVDDTSLNNPFLQETGYDTLNVGGGAVVGSWNGYVRAVRFYNTRKPNSFLQEITL